MRATAALLAVAAVAAFAPAAAAGSLPEGGPPILHAPPPRAPQLENTGPWRAPPILVSGASAYRDGEWVHQDFLFDDTGANGGPRDPGDARPGPHPSEGGLTGGDLFSAPNGTYTYPADPRYAGNAADLVELRVRPLGDATAFRLTFNSMRDPDLVATSILLGGDPGAPVELPFGAGARAPAEHVLLVRGATARLVTPDGRRVPGARPAAKVDLRRRQIEIRLPHAGWDPGRRTVRLAAAAGLWDAAAGRYLVPAAAADATHPGGAGTLARPPAFFNVVPRTAEPLPRPADVRRMAGDTAWWRDAAQGRALAAGDLSPFAAHVDFAKLRAGARDESQVPRSGPMNRIFASRFEPHQGVDVRRHCGAGDRCAGVYGSRLQPYALYVPERAARGGGHGLTLLLHSLTANHNQFIGSRNMEQFAERGAGHIVATPLGRGPDGWYVDHAEADVFEVWADVARHHDLDPRRTAISGYSMGGHGTFRLAARHPDLFARAFTAVGPPALGVWPHPLPPLAGEAASTTRMLGSLRHVPLLMWAAAADELVPLGSTQAQADAARRLGLRYRFDVFAAEHLTLALNDEFSPAAAFLGDAKVVRDPPRVVYAVDPRMDAPERGIVADGAYWVSGVRVRDPSGPAPLGQVDIRSDGFGQGEPPVGPVERGAGMLTGGLLAPLAHSKEQQAWGATPAAPARDRLLVRARNVRAVTVDPRRARVTCASEIVVDSDGPLDVSLAGCRPGRG